MLTSIWTSIRYLAECAPSYHQIFVCMPAEPQPLTSMRPFLHSKRLHHTHPLKDLRAMRAAARLFVGEHDFMQFTNTRFDKEGKNKSTIKTVLRVDIVLLGPEGDVVQVYRSQDGAAEKAVAGNQAATSNGGPGGDHSSATSRSSGISSSVDQSFHPQQHQSRHDGGADLQGRAGVHKRHAESSSNGVEDGCGRHHHSSSSSSSESCSHTLASNRQSLWYPHPDQFSGVRIEVEGEGFLFRQVRHMAGALLAVGSGRLTVGELECKLHIGGRESPGQGGRYRGWKVAEAKGLVLHSVQYPPGADDPTCLLYPGLTAEDNQQRLLGHDAE